MSERGSEEWVKAQMRRIFDSRAPKYAKLIYVGIALAEGRNGRGATAAELALDSSLSLATVRKYLRRGEANGMIASDGADANCRWRMRLPS